MDLSIKQKENETELRAFGRGALTVIVYSGDGADRESLSTVLLPAGVAEAVGWLLGWLAEHAPEERARLGDGLLGLAQAQKEALHGDVQRLTAERDALAEDLRASREAHANDQSATALEAERRKVDALDSQLAAIADAVGLGGTRTRWEGQLLGKVEGLVADVSDLRVALKRSNADCNTAIAEMHEAKRKSFAYLQMVGELVGAIVRPEVTRG